MLNNCRRLHTLYLKGCNEDTIRKIIESDGFPTGEAEDNWGETRKIYCLEKNVGKLTAPNGWEFVDCETGEIIGEKLVNYEKGMFSEKRDIEEVSVMVTFEHTDLSDMFQECENLKTINGIKNWDTSHVETMAGMFAGCKSLESLDLSNFNTSQVTNMVYMFSWCENLRELNLSNFDMCNIREKWNASMMFQDCRRLHTLRLDNCSRETVERIINSSWFPTGKAEDYEGTRKIYCKYFEVYDLTSPDGWVFEYID
jgi:surface protein